MTLPEHSYNSARDSHQCMNRSLEAPMYLRLHMSGSNWTFHRWPLDEFSFHNWVLPALGIGSSIFARLTQTHFQYLKEFWQLPYYHFLIIIFIYYKNDLGYLEIKSKYLPFRLAILFVAELDNAFALFCKSIAISFAPVTVTVFSCKVSVTFLNPVFRR